MTSLAGNSTAGAAASGALLDARERSLTINEERLTTGLCLDRRRGFSCKRVAAKGIGEIGITGAAAAIANAIYHATGKRIRAAPITPDKLI